MNSLVLGLFIKILATSVFCYATVYTHSVFAIESIDKSENNQLPTSELPLQIILPNLE